MLSFPSLKILMITGEYPPDIGGVGDYTSLLARHLCDSGAAVRILTSRSLRAPEIEDSIPSVRRSVFRWDARCLDVVESATRQFGASIVHLQYQAAAYGLLGGANMVPAYLRLRLPGVKVVTTFHDLRVPYLFPKAGPLRVAAVRALDRFSHRSVTTNRADLDSLGGTARGRRWLIHLGSNVDNAPSEGFERGKWRSSRFGAHDNTIVLGYFGFLNESKGVDLLVEALRLLGNNGLQAKLVVIGGQAGDTDSTNVGYSRRVVELVDRLGVVDRVVWTGFSSPREVSSHLLATDICVLPFRDGASLRRGSLLAALVHGRPIVTTQPSVTEPLLEDSRNVLMVRIGEVRAIVDAIVRLWRDPQLRDRLSAGALDLSAHFEWPEVARRHLNMYESLIEGRLDSSSSGAAALRPSG